VQLELSPEQRAARSEFRAFVAAEIVPHADRWEREEAIPMELVGKLRDRGWLGALLPAEVGGPGMDMITYGLLTEEIGKGCSSVRSLLTVHDMISWAMLRWGSRELRERVLPPMARGERLGALALSEPNAGSDAKSVETTAVADGDSFVLEGTKRWTTFGQIADNYLVLAQCEGKPTTFLLERETPGLTVKPIHGMMGTAASMLAQLEIAGCRVPKANLVGRIGFGVSHVLAAGLEQGRYSVAWGSVGLAQACLEASQRYAAERHQGGSLIGEHQLIRAMLSDMITNVRAARLLCLRAGYLRDRNDPGAFMETMVAKYFASTTATRAALDAVQIHGANGLSADYSVGRYLRDSRVMEIIEGSTQIQQITISRFDFQEF
jgi:alkylation response protein AidB-like acyl-CoA dehydrogenase